MNTEQHTQYQSISILQWPNVAFFWARDLAFTVSKLLVFTISRGVPTLAKAWHKMLEVGVAHKMQISDLCKLDNIT